MMLILTLFFFAFVFPTAHQYQKTENDQNGLSKLFNWNDMSFGNTKQKDHNIQEAKRKKSQIIRVIKAKRDATVDVTKEKGKGSLVDLFQGITSGLASNFNDPKLKRGLIPWIMHIWGTIERYFGNHCPPIPSESSNQAIDSDSVELGDSTES